jgi:hypothetical protein
MNQINISTSSSTSSSARTGSRFTRLLRGFVLSYVAQYETPGIDPTTRLRWTPVV